MESHSKSIFIFILNTSLIIIFLYLDIHTIVHNSFVNIDTPDMHFQFSALIPRPIWYVQNPILVPQCSSSLKKSKFQFQFQNRFQKSDSIPVQFLVTKTGTGNSNPPNSVQAQHLVQTANPFSCNLKSVLHPMYSCPLYKSFYSYQLVDLILLNIRIPWQFQH